MTTIFKSPNGNVFVPNAQNTQATKYPVQAAAAQVENAAIILDPTMTQFGSVSAIGVGTGDFFTLKFTGGTGSGKTFIIGDPSGIVAAASKITFNEPTSSTTSTVAAIKQQFTNPFLIKGINYEVTTSSTQFANDFALMMGDTSGRFQRGPINVDGAKRNTQYDPKLLTLEFTTPLRLDKFTAMSLFVSAGEFVTMTFFVQAFVN
jgi:hypothetical protein